MNGRDTTTLLHAVRQGSDEALNELFVRYGPRLLAVVRVRLGPELRSRMESRDVLGDALVRALQHLDDLRAEDGRSWMGWLARIVENEIRDRADFHRRGRRAIRAEVPLSKVDHGLVDRVRSQTSRLVLDERLGRLESALDRLSDEHREVILLRKLEELEFVEIGRRMDRSPDACRMLLARAMAALTLQVAEEA